MARSGDGAGADRGHGLAQLGGQGADDLADARRCRPRRAPTAPAGRPRPRTAPSASARSTSTPVRIPPSTVTIASTADGVHDRRQREAVGSTPSSCRRPWLDTTIPAAPAATAMRGVLRMQHTLDVHRQAGACGEFADDVRGEPRLDRGRHLRPRPLRVVAGGRRRAALGRGAEAGLGDGARVVDGEDQRPGAGRDAPVEVVVRSPPRSRITYTCAHQGPVGGRRRTRSPRRPPSWSRPSARPRPRPPAAVASSPSGCASRWAAVAAISTGVGSAAPPRVVEVSTSVSPRQHPRHHQHRRPGLRVQIRRPGRRPGSRPRPPGRALPRPPPAASSRLIGGSSGRGHECLEKCSLDWVSGCHWTAKPEPRAR